MLQFNGGDIKFEIIPYIQENENAGVEILIEAHLERIINALKIK